MKKLAFLLITFLFSSLAVAQPLRFVEGKHYKVISEKVSAQPNLTEFFSFYCPHCYRFEFIAKALEKGLPKGVKFNKSHVDFLHGATPEMQRTLSRALVTSELMGVGHKFIEAAFNQIHQERKPFNNEDDIIAVFAKIGADTDKAKKLLDSFSVKAAANKMKKDQDEMTKKRVLDGVPTLIVNGKYKLIGKELRSLEDYQSLVEYLLSLK